MKFSCPLYAAYEADSHTAVCEASHPPPPLRKQRYSSKQLWKQRLALFGQRRRLRVPSENTSRERKRYISDTDIHASGGPCNVAP